MTPDEQPGAPNANNPRLVLRVVGWVGRGLRSSRSLQEALGLDVRTVQYYLQAAVWLGLMEDGTDHLLTPAGLEVAFSDDPEEAYVRQVWAHPFVNGLLMGHPRRMPSSEDVIIAIARSEPNLAPATVRRRASAVRGLISIALEGRRPDIEHQLFLPLAAVEAPPEGPYLPREAGDHDPDVIRWLQCALVDHGELTLGQIRALLDRAGADHLALGAYVDLLLQRGDARRAGDRIVVTPGAVQRRGILVSTAGVMLSHPRYRRWLDDLEPADAGDRPAQIRREEVAARYRAWDQRLFGHAVTSSSLPAALGKILLDRSLSAWPTAGEEGPPIDPVEASFLDAWTRPPLIVTLPPSLAQLQGGLPAVNRALGLARTGQTEVAPPDLATRPDLVHGGLLHPGEPRPRSVPDLVSLRQRVLMNVPYASMIAAMLLLHRQEPERWRIKRMRGGWRLIRGGRPLGALLDVCDTFAEARGLVPSRRTSGGLGASDLITCLESIGICHVAGDVVVLADRLFLQLRTDPELAVVHTLLMALSEGVEAVLLSLEPDQEAAP